MKTLRIPTKELQFRFSRSSGAGGQNVNKVNTRVTLQWNIEKTRCLPSSVKERFYEKFSHRILEDGHVVVTSQRFRMQARNIADCVEKLHSLIDQVTTPPKRRKKTKVKKSAIQKRLNDKKRHGEKKRMRQKP